MNSVIGFLAIVVQGTVTGVLAHQAGYSSAQGLAFTVGVQALTIVYLAAANLAARPRK